MKWMRCSCLERALRQEAPDWAETSPLKMGAGKEEGLPTEGLTKPLVEKYS